MNRSAIVAATTAMALSLLAGCAVGPRYERPAIVAPATLAAPAAEATMPSAASLADRPWWELVDDPVLAGLIDEALRNNHNLRIAAQRVVEARANAGIAAAERWPAAQASAGGSRSRQSASLNPFTETLNLADVNLGLSWEIDLWGRIRHLDEAALARFLASEEAQRGVVLSLVAEVASGYYELAALDVQLGVARRTAAAFAETYDLFASREEAGLASSLERQSAAAQLATTTAVIPDLERRIASAEHRLAFLLGRNPGAITRGAPLDEQRLLPEIPAGLPSDLLERRPDLRQAERELQAASAEVGVALAEMFPRISLTAAFGGVAPQVSELFSDGKSWSVGAGLLTPVFHGQRLRDQHRAAVARFEQAKLRYEQSVTAAFGEVATALVAYEKLAAVEGEQTRAAAALRDAVELARTRYLTGLADYFEVLQAQQQLFPAENALAATRATRLSTLVALYRALGGGWQLAPAAWSERPAATVAAR